MTTTAAGPGRPSRSWLVFLLAALTFALGLLLPAGPALAATSSATETRVRVFLPAAPDLVGVHECITAGQRPVRGPSQPGVASGRCVATESAAKSCSVNSFTADTPVLLADGTSKPIEQVKVGDQVEATDPDSGASGSRPVTQLIRHSGPHTMVDLTLADGSVLHATDHHPLWDATRAAFTYAIDLHPGEQLRRPDGTLLTLTAVVIRQQNLTAYNLTINGIHTYYAGTTPLLVHNSCGIPADGSRMSVNQALERGQHWLGKGYSEPAAGSGRFVSSDGSRAFRMGRSDITGAHGGGPHVNFEELVANPARPSRLMVGSNSHVYLLDE